MRIVRYTMDGSDVRYGIVEKQRIRNVTTSPFDGLQPDSDVFDLTDVQLLAPVMPPNVIAIGANYQQHIEEAGAEPPPEPLVFIKASTAVTAPDAAIVLPSVAPDEVDYEAELAIVIGRKGKHIPEAAALDYVLGYTCANDVSARDCQMRRDKQWARAKSFDSFCPLGPWIETDVDPDACDIALRLNGRVMQQSNTADMLFDCRRLISHVSDAFTLLPGTVILTGTPSGVGFARTPPVFLRAGDVVEVDIAGIGVLRNSVCAE